MNIKENYIKYGSKLNTEFTSKHNKAMTKLCEIYKQAKDIEDKSFYLDLLKHENPHIRLTVAAHCLGFNIYLKEAIKVIRFISKKEKNPLLAYEAQNVLKVYKKEGQKGFIFK